MLQIEAIAQGVIVCNFLLAPHLKLVAPGNRATVSVEPRLFANAVTMGLYNGSAIEAILDMQINIISNLTTE